MLNIRSRIRTRILLLTGTVISLLMLLISFVLLLKWRELIIRNQSENAVSITRTFSVTVIDAMILEEQLLYGKEDILEPYVENFIAHLGNVHYVGIFDTDGSSIIELSGRQENQANVPLVTGAPAGATRQIRIYEHPEYGWTMEVLQPLILSGKRWGTATVGFDAEPMRDEIRSVFFLLLISTVMITSVVLLVLIVFINRMTSSIERLARALDSIDFHSGGVIDLPEQRDEIGFFYQHFKLLQGRLETSRKELENAHRQIYQAEKLASIGRLASGVAHQVNNPLNGIKSCLYAMKQSPEDQNKIHEYLQLINEGINDIEIVVKKLLGFARQQSISETRININDAIRKVISVFELRLKEKRIEVRTELADGVREVRIDYHLFQEVVMNLLLNSYDAVGQNGLISIATGNDGSSGVFMEMRDNGSGIAPDDMKKIFDPFFTTKEVGVGTGLGLSVCMGIVESHGGSIEVRSTQNLETVFRITLPADERQTAPH